MYESFLAAIPHPSPPSPQGPAGAPPQVTGCGLSLPSVRFSQFPRGKSEMRQSPRPRVAGPRRSRPASRGGAPGRGRAAAGAAAPPAGGVSRAGPGEGKRERGLPGKGRAERAGRRVARRGGGVASAAATGRGRVGGASVRGLVGRPSPPPDRCSAPGSAERPGPAAACVREGGWGREM